MIQYIDKSEIVSWIKRRIILLENNSDGIISMLASGMFVNEYKDLLSFLDTLEVKEVSSNDAFIEKACKLLMRMIWEVTYEDLEGNSAQHYDKMEFIEYFRKHMKGE